MEAGKRSIREIFNRGRNLEIPFFQRAYVWDKDQWQRFLEDMRMVSITRKPYFLGSVILKQQETTSDQDSKLTVIDGQQRLTTLNIFLKVLCLKKNADTEFTDTFKKQRDKSIILLHNHNNESSFNEIVELNELKVFEKYSKDHILGAYNFFVENINGDDLAGGLDFYNILDNILFVGIDLNEHEDEQQIFDTINSLGVRLTTAELLKNYFFNRDIAAYNEYWKEIFEPDDDETKRYWDHVITTGRVRRTFIDLFFNSYLQIKIQESGLKVRADDKSDYSKVDSLFESYKKFIKDYGLDKKTILTEIKEYALIFRANFNCDVVNCELTSEYGMERINTIIFGLDTSTLIPYTLYVLKNVSNENERNSLFEIIESYIMRRMVVRATTKNYNQLFTDQLISNEILSKDEFNKYISTLSDRINFFPRNEELISGFHTSHLNNKQASGIIYLIESKIRDRRKHSTQLLGLNNYSLEHLMPKKWTNNWGKLGREERDFRNHKLLTLGNLAIITQSLNSAIRDSSWSMKKKGKPSKEGLMRYSSGIETLAAALELEVWNEAEIENRANLLGNMALNLWKREVIEEPLTKYN